MEITLRAHRAFLDPETAEIIKRRLGSAIGLIQPFVRRVTAQLEDENGDKGGLDKLCTVIVDVQGSGRVVVRERKESFLAAATTAAHRIAVAVRSRLHRRRGIRRGRPMEAYLEVVLPG